MRGDVVEELVVGHLLSMGLVVKPYPQDVSGYLPDTHTGEILVKYTGAKNISRDISASIVDSEVYLELIFVFRELRGEDGLYKTMDKVSAELDGFTIAGVGGAMFLESETMLDEYNGVWQYQQKWTIKRIFEHEQSDDYADRYLGA